MQSVLRLGGGAARLSRGAVYARSARLQPARTFSVSLARRSNDKNGTNYDVEKRLEEQRKIDEQKEKDKMRVYGQHYQDKEGLEVPEIAATDDSIAHVWRETEDVGHATIGAGHGRHQARTLASFSMEGKVWMGIARFRWPSNDYQVCIVTGAARGLGNLFARTFVESGCTKIVLMDLKQEDAQKAADDLVEWFVEHGDIGRGKVTAIGLGCDVANEDSVKAGFEEVVRRFGKIDAMVASAGIVENFSAFELSGLAASECRELIRGGSYPTNRMRLLYDINVHGAFYCAREAARHMLEKNVKGSIVLVSSMSASVNRERASAHGRESGGGMGQERDPGECAEVSGKRGSSMADNPSPGYMLTSLTRAILDKNEELKNTWVNLTPMGRMGEPEDLKGAVIYLASDASGFTSGTELRVDGAYTCIYMDNRRVYCLSPIYCLNGSLIVPRVPVSAMMADPLPPPCQLPTPGPSPVGPISPATGLPDALAHIPIDYIIDRLRAMAPYYWHRPDTTNCTIIVPTEPLRMFSRVANSHSGVGGTSSNGPPTIRDSRRSSAPSAGARQPIRVRLHQDYLTAQSALFRNLFSHSAITHLDPASPGTRPLFTFSSLRHPRMSGPTHNPTVLLPVPDHASFALLIHYLYFGDTRTIENALRTGAVTWEGCVRNVEYLGLRDEIKRFLGRWWRLWIAGGGNRQLGRRATDSVQEEDEQEPDSAPRTLSDAADQEAETKDYASAKVHTGQGLVDPDELAAMLERV
ncbi:D-arabinitol 2-dehydrogenase [Ceratobasidium theobromae]|uniref:D-arabinitol 2-dehydrogenase n=1 Tax=Ceratobasidium theobromae TaxID=1582974 RepID=A0A5N5QWY2_9AGAM|nr:D-arabinitol 2-dehydrogenase [Ceratobasidium theobromae]